jgi:2-iminobutanoate/2-iminopropanoate deaminase
MRLGAGASIEKQRSILRDKEGESSSRSAMHRVAECARSIPTTTTLRGGRPLKALISSDKIPAPPGPYSPGLTVGEWIFLSGQGGFDPNTGKVVSADLAEQTEQTFDNIETILVAAGASLDDVVSCLVHLVDLADFPAFNAVYEQKFNGVKPVRTTVRADLVAGMRVEITVVARRG